MSTSKQPRGRVRARNNRFSGKYRERKWREGCDLETPPQLDKEIQVRRWGQADQGVFHKEQLGAEANYRLRA